MKNHELIVSDTNIFFDLYKTDLLKEFFSLPYKIKTTMFVFSEIKEDKELQVIKPFVDNKRLDVEKLSDKEFENCFILKLTTPGKLSIADCSVWLAAKKYNAKLLTSDRNLRKAAEKDNVEVHGIFFAFEELLKNKIITLKRAADAVESLKKTNKRFPKKIAEAKMNEWESKFVNPSKHKIKSPAAGDGISPEL